MKLSRAIKIFAVSLSCIIATATAVPNISNPIKADASFHWDWWNEYEDNALVIWRRFGSFNCYKVFVYSADGHRIWTNNDPAVPYFYPHDLLYEMISREPGNEGYCHWDVRVDMLNNELYFRRSCC